MKKELMLVTGANGYVGEEMVRYLIGEGVPVRAMVRRAEAGTKLRELGAEVVIGDLQNEESLRPAVKGVYGVFHIGAIFRQAGLPESDFYDINAEGTRRMLDVSIEAGVKRFIHCSTGGVLGHVANPPGGDTSPYNPGDMYQRTKLEGELIAMRYFKEGKIRGAVIRPAMIYGPGDTRNLKMFRMIARKRFFFVGKGDKHVHFVDVRDLVKGFALAMEHEEINAQVYHIPGERAVPLKEMVSLICRYLKVPEPWLHIPVKPMQWLGSACEIICTPFRIQPPIYKRRVDFFTKNRHFDISKAERELGYRPAKKLEDEVKEVVDWYRENSWL